MEKVAILNDIHGNLFYHREDSDNCNYYLKNNTYNRIPEFDKTHEIEVEG